MTAQHDTLSQDLDLLLAKQTAPALFKTVLTRWETLFNPRASPAPWWAEEPKAACNRLVSSLLCYLHASKHGLSERELLQ